MLAIYFFFIFFLFYIGDQLGGFWGTETKVPVQLLRSSWLSMEHGVWCPLKLQRTQR